jgi:hypothetical protein
MLTLRRFTVLAESFGADLQRWPAETQGDAQALLAASAEARAVLDEARQLDEAIVAARRLEEAALWQPGEMDAALARLQSGVAGRIAPGMPRRRSVRERFGWAFSGGGSVLGAPVGWIGFAASGAVAVAAGLLIGSLSAAAPAPGDILAVFQAATIPFLAG